MIYVTCFILVMKRSPVTSLLVRNDTSNLNKLTPGTALGIHVKKLLVWMITFKVFPNVTFVHKNIAYGTLFPNYRSHTDSSSEGIDS